MSQSRFHKSSIATLLGLVLTSSFLSVMVAHAGTDQLWHLGNNGTLPKNANIVSIKDGQCVDAQTDRRPMGPGFKYTCAKT
jgi:hypothetical protein